MLLPPALSTFLPNDAWLFGTVQLRFVQRCTATSVISIPREARWAVSSTAGVAAYHWPC